MGDGEGSSPITMENLIALQKTDPESYLELLKQLELANQSEESLRELKPKKEKES